MNTKLIKLTWGGGSQIVNVSADIPDMVIEDSITNALATQEDECNEFVKLVQESGFFCELSSIDIQEFKF